MDNGLCRMHNGNNLGGRPVIHGRYSLKHRETLHTKIEQFRNDPDPGNLSDELALLRAVLQEFLERFPGDTPLPSAAINAIYSMVEGIGRKVERISKILNETALTQAEVQFLQATAAEILFKYVPAERLDDAMGEAERAFLVRSLPAGEDSGTPKPENAAGVG